MNKSIKIMLITALFMAMTAVLTLFLKIPVPNGYIHVGDSVIYLAACILPFPYALIAAGVGGALADMLGGYIIWIIPTLIIKMLNTLPFTSKCERILTVRNALTAVVSGLITIVGYCIASGIIYGRAAAIASIIGSAVQAAGSAVLFLVFAAALDKIKFKQKFIMN